MASPDSRNRSSLVLALSDHSKEERMQWRQGMWIQETLDTYAECAPRQIARLGSDCGISIHMTVYYVAKLRNVWYAEIASSLEHLALFIVVWWQRYTTQVTVTRTAVSHTLDTHMVVIHIPDTHMGVIHIPNTHMAVIHIPDIHMVIRITIHTTSITNHLVNTWTGYSRTRPEVHQTEVHQTEVHQTVSWSGIILISGPITAAWHPVSMPHPTTVLWSSRQVERRADSKKTVLCFLLHAIPKMDILWSFPM